MYGLIVFARLRQCAPHLTHASFSPPESTSHTAYRSVQPFLQGSRLWQTDRQTDRPSDHATPSVTTGRIYVVLRCSLIIKCTKRRIKVVQKEHQVVGRCRLNKQDLTIYFPAPWPKLRLSCWRGDVNGSLIFAAHLLKWRWENDKLNHITRRLRCQPDQKCIRRQNILRELAATDWIERHVTMGGAVGWAHPKFWLVGPQYS